MKRFPLIAALLTLSLPAVAQTTPVPAISVSGEATISVPPDLAQIDAGMTTEGRTAREAIEANNKTMGAVLIALKAAGIPEKDFQTARLSLSPVTAPNKTTNVFQTVGYRASNRVIVTLRDVKKVADAIDAAVGAGANELGGVSFMVSNASKLLDEARAKALEDAKRKADIYAAASGVAVGPPLSITEDGAPAPMFRRMAAPKAAMAATPVAEGEETLRVGVNVTYEIKPKAQ